MYSNVLKRFALQFRFGRTVSLAIKRVNGIDRKLWRCA